MLIRQHVCVCVCVCVYGCVEKESDRCIEHCALAAHAQCQRMKKCVLFFFVVCAGINKQTDAHCVFKFFCVTFIVLEPCLFLEKKRKLVQNYSTAPMTCACSKKWQFQCGQKVLDIYNLLGLRGLQSNAYSPSHILLEESCHRVLKEAMCFSSLDVLWMQKQNCQFFFTWLIFLRHIFLLLCAYSCWLDTLSKQTNLYEYLGKRVWLLLKGPASIG